MSPPNAPEGSPAEAPPAAPRFQMKRIGTHTLVYGLGVLLSKAVSFVMLPIYTRFLTPADYGVMELIEMTLDVISIAAGARIAVGVFRYYHKVETQEEKDAVVSTALIVLAATYVAMATATYLASPVLSQAVFASREQTGLIRLAALSLGFQSLIIAPLAYIRVRERSTLFVAANLAKLVIGLTSNIVLVVGRQMGVEGVFISSLIANVVVGIWLAGYLIHSTGLRFSRPATRNLLRYGIPLMVTQFATFIATFGDRYFLRQAASVDEVGVYSLAYKFGFLLAVVGYTPFASVWEPARFEMAHREDRDRLYARGFVFMNVLLLSVAVGIVLFGSDVVRIMASPSFFRAGALIPVIVVAYVFQSWTNFQDLGIHMREKTEYITLANWICAFVAVAGYWFLIPRYYGMGAAVTTVIAFGVRHLVVYWISQRIWPVEYDWKPVLVLLALAGATSAASLAIPFQTSLWTSLPIRAALFGGFALSVWRVGILSDGEREAILSMAKTLLGRVALALRLTGRPAVESAVKGD